MKRKAVFLSTLILLLPLLAQAQNLDDALRYSRIFYQGTARYNGMGGAFTALGGDISSIAVNPAGAAVFRSTEFAITPTFIFRNVTTSYNGTGVTNETNNFTLGQGGLVAATTTGKSTGLVGLSFAYTYNRTNDFYNHSVIDGTSNASSMTDFWASQANGYNTWELADYTTAPYMAYEAWLIDTIPGSYTDYASIFSYYGEMDPVYGQHTTRVIDNEGFTGDHTIALSANISNILYIGTALGIQTLNYTGHYQHSEVDEGGNVPDLVHFTYTDHFQAEGSGVNFKAGFILRPIESFRLGISFSTPTTYKIDEVFYSNLSAYLDNDTPGDTGDDADPVLEQDPFNNYYRIKTPFRLNAGAAIQVGNFAMLSADYEFVDYSKATLSQGVDNYNFQAENEEIKSTLVAGHGLRLGAEIKMGPVYLRGGAGYYTSAFKSGTINEGADYINLSGGLGYRHQSFYVDFSLSGMLNDEVYMMYPDPWLEPVDISNRDIRGALTVGVKF